MNQSNAQPSSVTVGCFAAFVIEEAKRGGFAGFAQKLEDCFVEFLGDLTKDERQQTLMLSYQLASQGPAAAPFKLRLVHSHG